jgi:PhoH-like ATPase
MEESFSEKTPDHRILAIALFIHEKFKERSVILISKDINLRMKAKSLGLKTEDYENDKVKNIEILHKGVETYDDFDPEVIDLLYKTGSIPRAKFPMDQAETPANQYFILRNNNQSVLDLV